MYINECKNIIYDSGTEVFVICSGTCVFTNEPYSVAITYEEFCRIIQGEVIQEVIPHVPAADREFLITGISPRGYNDLSRNILKRPKKIFDSQELVIRKENWSEFDYIINKFGIKKLFHFTDKRNLSSIKNINGLLSWEICSENYINIEQPGGDDL